MWNVFISKRKFFEKTNGRLYLSVLKRIFLKILNWAGDIFLKINR